MVFSPDKPVQGNTNTYALRKLRKDRPDLHEQVLAGELNPELKGHGNGPGRGHKRDDNIMSFPQGTSETYALRRLRRDNPELKGHGGDRKSWRPTGGCG